MEEPVGTSGTNSDMWEHVLLLVQTTEEEKELQQNIKIIWENLFDEARRIDRKLGTVKKKFTKTTKQEIQMFASNLAAFASRFRLQGPSSVGEDLDTG
ncbi:hypothetical protein scyTo_0022850 [Scyliorhinus torazame]|uniref:Uncharacterized protein n=1 Tax=Scyliorhinus torazame TaxID=75743 RepID=A0A401Q9G5_SCYTO|nr:hypothetical protein [Scyliorhinus torazame]